MEKLYICPKAKDLIDCICDLRGNNYCADLEHTVPHEHIKSCDTTTNCPACIEYKPEPQNEPQLYILPPKDTIKCPNTECITHGSYTENCFSCAAYSSAIPIDKEELAEKIWQSVPEYVGHYNLTKIRQAIEEFIKE